MAPLQGNQFLKLDPDQKRRASSRVTDPVISLCSMPAPPKGELFAIFRSAQIKLPPERVPPIAAVRLGLCVKMSLSRPAGRDKLKNIKFIPLIMAERSGAIFQWSLRSASQNFQNMQFILAKVLFLPCEYCIMAISMQVLPVKKRLLAKAKLSNMTKKEVFYYE